MFSVCLFPGMEIQAQQYKKEAIDKIVNDALSFSVQQALLMAVSLRPTFPIAIAMLLPLQSFVLHLLS